MAQESSGQVKGGGNIKRESKDWAKEGERVRKEEIRVLKVSK